MKVLYDNQIFNVQKYGGISRYFSEIYFNAVGYIPKINIKYTNNSYLLNKYPDLLIPKIHNYIEGNLFKGQTKIFRLFNNLFNVDEIKKQEKKTKSLLIEGCYDIFHPTYYDSYFLKYSIGKPFVLTVHDMTYELFPEYFNDYPKIASMKKILCEKATRIIAVSENTKNDIVKLLNISPEKIDVIYHGNSINPVITNENIELKDIPSKYLLYVGNRATYKNFKYFIKSIAELLLNTNDLFLVCAGNYFNDVEKIFVAKLGLTKKIVQLLVNEKTLAALYKNAQMFVFPSLYEGFGMPVLEAFACGCPVVLSNCSSLPEIAGDAGLYFDPKDANSIKTAVSKILAEPNLRNSLIAAGYERIKQFSWQKTALAHAEVYKKALLSKKGQVVKIS